LVKVKRIIYGTEVAVWKDPFNKSKEEQNMDYQPFYGGHGHDAAQVLHSDVIPPLDHK
jgi:hypothetical protein